MIELVAILWAIFAPVLMLVPGGAIYLATGRIKGLTTKRQRLLVATLVTLLVVFAMWLRDRLRFEAHCEAIGTAQVFEKRAADGFFLDDSTANSFGMRYLQEEGFQWMEARSIYRRGGFTRYENTPAGIRQTEIDSLTAAIEVKSEHASDSLSSTTFVSIRDRQSGKVLARAASSYFNGGAARLFLGAWGTGSCPSTWTEAGSAEFRRVHHLAKLTLQ